MTRQTPSNGAGQFVFASVVPGTNYTITVSLKGFKNWQSQPFAVRPGDRVDFKDNVIAMQIATAATEITVEGTGSSVKTLTSGERSDVINSKEMNSLAIVGRDATELVRMLPGFSLNPGDNGLDNRNASNQVVGTEGATGSYAAAGIATNGVSIVSDGASIVDIGTGKGQTQNLNIDMVEEIKVSSSYGAENARGPVVINAVGKSGSSAYHGSAYFHARDTILNANDWMDNHQGYERPDGRYIYPGGTIGGPLYLPLFGFNKNKDKAFFFFGYENYRQHFEGALVQTWVPTLAERAGDFSRASLDAQLCGPRPDGKPNPNANLMMCNTMNYLADGTDLTALTGNNISMSALAAAGLLNRVSPTNMAGGQALMNFLPLPNTNPFTNEGGFNYTKQVVQTQNGSELKGRLDYNFNDNNKMFLSYGRQAQIRFLPVMYGGWLPTNSMEFPGNVSAGDMSHTFSVNYTRVFSPTLTNELTAAMSFINQPNRMDNPENVNRFNLGYNYFGQFKNTGDYSMPALQDWSQLGYPAMLMPGGFYNNSIKMKKAVPNLADNLSWVHGAHLIKAGFYTERGYLNGLPDYNYYPQGALSFAPWTYMWAPGPSTAAQWVGCNNPEGTLRNNGAMYDGNCINPVAMMYLGYVDHFEQANFTPVVNMQYNNYAAYLTDSWKMTKRLTLDVGARFERMGPWFDRKGSGLAVFSPSLYSSQCVGNACTDEMPGITYHGLDNSVRNSVVSLPSIIVSPRFGMALDVFGTGKTVVRGGWGIYRSQEEFQPYARAAATATGFKVTSMNSSNTELLSLDTIETRSPNGAIDFDAYAIDAKDTNRPVTYQYNFTFSQRMPWNSLMEIAYVGNNTEHLNSGTTKLGDINLIQPGQLFLKNGTILTDSGAQFLGSMTQTQIDYFRPYSYYKSVNVLKHNLYSNYNSLQATWNKQAGWVTFGANYTFSKALQAGGIVPNPFNIRDDYYPASFDRSHVFNVHYVIDLGDKFRAFAPLHKILKGVQLSGITTLQSGPPLNALTSPNLGFGGSSAAQPVFDRWQWQATTQDCTSQLNDPNAIWCYPRGGYISNTSWLGTPDLTLMPRILCDPSADLQKNQYVNYNCFAMPALGENGDYRMPYMHGPAFMNHDLTVTKNFKMSERKNLLFRFAAFNFLNHPLVSFNKSDSKPLQMTFQYLAAGQQMAPVNLQNQDFGMATAKYGNRLVELTVKFEF